MHHPPLVVIDLARHPLPRFFLPSAQASFLARKRRANKGLESVFQVRYYSRPFVEYGDNLAFLGTRQMTTVSAKPAEVRREWYVVDAEGKTLGRMASEIARRLKGKHKPIYTPHVDTGDYVVVINAEKLRVTGNKMQDKMYHHHTGYIGNLKSINLAKLLEKAPERVLETAVKGMLPRNPLGRAMFSKLKVYAGSEHPHTAQQPKPLDI